MTKPTDAPSMSPDSKLAVHRIPGEALVPDLSRHTTAVLEERYYWIGALPTLPAEGADIAGLNFAKVNEDVGRDASGRTTRVPRIGAIVQITQDRLDKIRERLQRTVVRFIEDDTGQHEEPGTGKNIGHPYRRPRRGHLITIPTPEHIRGCEAAGRPVRRYSPQKNDRPAADYLFAVPCPNQKNPQQGMEYPPPLSETGLEWKT